MLVLASSNNMSRNLSQPNDINLAYMSAPYLLQFSGGVVPVARGGRLGFGCTAVIADAPVSILRL